MSTPLLKSREIGGNFYMKELIKLHKTYKIALNLGEIF